MRRRNIPRGRASGEAGFTVVELMVASTVLIVGMLGVLSMLTGALGATATSNKRVAATNLARELVETARGLSYEDLDFVTTRLQARGLGAGTPWTIARRGVTYTVTATTCTFDDPSDGYAATPPANACSANAAGSDSNGDDFRRVTFKLDYADSGKARSTTQTTLVVNPSGGLGPRILSMSPLTQTITNPAITSATIGWTTTPAVSLHWDLDDGVSSGNVAGASPYTATWSLGTVGSGSEVLDGSYTMAAQAFDDRNVPGETKRADIVLNRRAPYAPTGFAGGHDTRSGDWVDFVWALNRERDVLGYRVVWTGPDGVIGNGNDEQVCPAPAAGSMLSRTTTTCADFSPAPGSQKYYVVAIDRDASNSLRDGDPRLLTIDPAGARPNKPVGPLTVATVNSAPRLSWSAPPGGASFYRVYRDGVLVGYADRYDTSTATTYTDAGAGTVAHTYWVTAVNDAYNESDPLGPVVWLP